MVARHAPKAATMAPVTRAPGVPATEDNTPAPAFDPPAETPVAEKRSGHAKDPVTTSND